MLQLQLFILSTRHQQTNGSDQNTFRHDNALCLVIVKNDPLRIHPLNRLPAGIRLIFISTIRTTF